MEICNKKQPKTKQSKTLIMKNLISRMLILSIVASLFTSCELIGDIFQAGMGVGIFLVVAVIILIFIVIAKIGKK